MRRSFGLAAVCGAVAALAACETLAGQVSRPITLKANGYFGYADGAAFVPLGGFYANWPGKENPDSRKVLPPRDLMPASTAPFVYPFDETVSAGLRNWFGYLKREGITSLRLMLRGMDIVGRVHPERLKAVLDYMGIAAGYGIKFQVVLFDDYNKPPYTNKDALEKVALPAYTPEQLAGLPAYRKRFLVDKKLAADKFTDPDVFACEQDYLNELIPILAARPEIYAYEIENEQAPKTDQWVRKIVAHIRGIDPVTATIGNPVELNPRTFYAWSRTGISALNMHPYNHGDQHNASNVYNATRAKQACAVLPAFNGESAMNCTARAKVPEDEAAQNARDNIWPTIAAGCIGCLMWVPEYRGEVEEFGLASRILRDFDFAGFKRDKPDIQVFQSTSQEDDLHDAMRWTGFCMRTGYDFDLVIEDGSGPPSTDRTQAGCVAVRVTRIPTPRAVAGAWRPFDVASGYFAQPLVGNRRTKGLVYLANIAGGMKQGADKQWMRARSPVDLTLSCHLGPDRFALSVYDLDSGGKTVKSITGDDLVSIGRTSHDYVVVFKSAGR